MKAFPPWPKQSSPDKPETAEATERKVQTSQGGPRKEEEPREWRQGSSEKAMNYVSVHPQQMRRRELPV